MLDQRHKKLLQLVVEEMIETGEPVGSQRLAEASRLGVSSATIRNWFAELENAGYLMQPHTSSGRVPTEEGYRLYYDELMTERAPRRQEWDELRAIAERMSRDAVRATRLLAKLAADISDEAVIVGDEHESFFTGLSYLLAQPEFHSDPSRMQEVGRALDRLDEIVGDLRRADFAEPTALIGRDCPFGSDCASLIVTLPDGMLFGILGPLRMNYAGAYGLLRRLKELYG